MEIKYPNYINKGAPVESLNVKARLTNDRSLGQACTALSIIAYYEKLPRWLRRSKHLSSLFILRKVKYLPESFYSTIETVIYPDSDLLHIRISFADYPTLEGAISSGSLKASQQSATPYKVDDPADKIYSGPAYVKTKNVWAKTQVIYDELKIKHSEALGLEKPMRRGPTSELSLKQMLDQIEIRVNKVDQLKKEIEEANMSEASKALKRLESLVDRAARKNFEI